jgi:hypothetical protein
MGNPTFSSSSEAAEYSRRTAYYDGTAPSAAVRKRRRSKNAARPGEQVAAKVTRTDENGSWILASVQRFYADTETYDVQDEDDTTKLIRLPWNHVMRLSTGAEGCFKKGTQCMAIFPETTSFYRASKCSCYFIPLFLSIRRLVLFFLNLLMFTIVIFRVSLTVVSKQPIWKLTPGSTSPIVKELVLKFEVSLLFIV